MTDKLLFDESNRLFPKNINIVRLDISRRKLTHLPDDLHIRYPRLISLNCEYNNLQYLPYTMPSTLRKLYCGWNNIVEIPDAEWIQNLYELHCNNNNIDVLPVTMTSLHTLSIKGNSVYYTHFKQYESLHHSVCNLYHSKYIPYCEAESMQNFVFK